MNPTNIEWCDFTWNPVTGCFGPKVSPGCDNCYAERTMNTRLRHLRRYDGDKEPFQNCLFHEDRLLQPLRRKKPSRIFVCSMSDLFHDLVVDEWLAQIFTVMALCPQHTFMLLTKRPGRMRDWISDETDNGGVLLFNALHDVCARAGLDPDAVNSSITWPLPNVWLGVTVCNQAELVRHLPVLLQTPAAKRYLCFEPFLGAVDVRKAYPQDYMHCSLCKWHGFNDELEHRTVGIYEEEFCPDCGNDGTFALDYPHEDSELALGGIDWVICGGETGPGARPMHPDWVRGLRDQCGASRSQPTPFFFKGWGEWLPSSQAAEYEKKYGGIVPGGHYGRLWPNGVFQYQQPPAYYAKSEKAVLIFRVGKRRSGRLLDGEEWSEVPK